MTETLTQPSHLSQTILCEAERYEPEHPHKPLLYALADLTADKSSATFSGVVTLLKQRPSLTADHLGPIVYAAAQYADTRHQTPDTRK